MSSRLAPGLEPIPLNPQLGGELLQVTSNLGSSGSKCFSWSFPEARAVCYMALSWQGMTDTDPSKELFRHCERWPAGGPEDAVCKPDPPALPPF
jgi:hypothetical protein